MTKKASMTNKRDNKKTTKSVNKPSEVINSRWFKLRLIEKGLSQRDLAKRLGVEPSALNHMVNGRRSINKEYLDTIAKLLGLTLPELLAGLKHTETTPEAHGELEIAGWIDGALIVHKGHPKGPRNAPNPQAGASVESIEVLRCQTMGSQFDGIDGALVYYYPTNRVDPDSLQRLCIVEIGSKGGVRAMRVVKRGYSVGRYNLALFNGVISEEDCEITSSAPVMWMKM